MAETISLLTAWRWPIAVIVSTLLASRAVVAVARCGIRVEIFTRQPILAGAFRDRPVGLLILLLRIACSKSRFSSIVALDSQ